jgi:hypothetical protein
MVSSPKPPTPPDPNVTAAAQTGTNIATAQANAALNNINQVTPYGNLTYSDTGSRFINDPNGQTYYTDGKGNYQTSQPMTYSAATAATPGHWDASGPPLTGHNSTGGPSMVWVPGTQGSSGAGTPNAGWTAVKGEYVPTQTATQTLSPQEQAIFDQSEATKLNLGTLANQESAKMIDYLNTPVDLSAANIDKYSNTHYLQGFNQQWDRQNQQLQQQLADTGAQVGSQAYTNAYNDFYKQKQASNDQYLGDMYNNAQQAILTQRNQPINEISALLGGSSVTQPNYASGTQTSAIPTVDYAGLVQQNFANQSQNYQAQLANQQATMGGLFGLAGAGLGGWAKTGFALSDRRLKNEIERVGTLPSGLPIYEYNYIWGGRQIGVMADEVLVMFPDAVVEGPSGFDMVDYARIA